MKKWGEQYGNSKIK